MNPELKERVLAFMRANRLTVISTVDTERNKPEAAVIAFTETDTFELIFGTSNSSRKYRNLATNPNVSFVIGWTDEFGTIQYEGVAQELSSDESAVCGNLLADKNEKSRAFFTRDDQRYFRVKPTWLRFTDKTKKPQEVIEVSF